MTNIVTRYERDTSAPRLASAARDLVVRVVAPAIVLWAVIVGVGLLIVDVFDALPSENDVNASLQQGRTAAWDAVTRVWSMIGNTEVIIATCVLVVVVLWWRTRQWWLAVVPAIAIWVQASVFVLATAVVGRDRPDVEHLDPAPPTSSYPSGHVGASTALYLTFALLAQRIRRPWLRWVVTAVCLLVPLLVGYARLYRGMHHVTDVLVGYLNGIVCAGLAWGYLRRDGGPTATSDEAERPTQSRA